MLHIMCAIGIARKSIYSTLFAYLAWRKSRAEHFWDKALSISELGNRKRIAPFYGLTGADGCW